MDIGGQLTLNGSGTYIFRPNGAFTTTAGAVVTLSGSSACDVFWTPTAATTLGASTTFSGTVIQPLSSAITVGANTTWTGRALAFGGTVTTGATDTLNVPVCAAVIPPAPLPATLHVVKLVVNNSGGTATQFNMHVRSSGADVAGSPAIGLAGSGVAYTLPAGTYVVSEDANPTYAASFSGACNSSGSVILSAGADMTCVVTNDDIATAVIPPIPTVTPPPAIPTPTLPNTGVEPNSQSVTWPYPVALLGGFVLAAVFIKRKQMFPAK